MYAGDRQIRSHFLEAGRPVGIGAGILAGINGAVGKGLVALAAVHGYNAGAQLGLDLGPVGNAADLQALDVLQAGNGRGGVVEDLRVN